MTRYNIHIDKLKLSYSISETVYQYITAIPLNDSVLSPLSGDLTITQIPTQRKHTLQFLIRTPQDGSYSHFCTLLVDDTFYTDRNNVCSIIVENWSFYQPMDPSGAFGNTASIAGFTVDYIANELGLTLQSIDCLDIAVDTPQREYVKLIRSAIRKYTPIVSGVHYPNTDDVISNLLYISQGTRTRITDTSIYVKQESRAELSIYNKSAELQNAHKPYITATLDPQRPTYRIEIRLKSKAIGEFIHKIKSTLTEFYQKAIYFEDRDALTTIMADYTDRLLHFINDDGQKISIFELKRPLPPNNNGRNRQNKRA